MKYIFENPINLFKVLVSIGLACAVALVLLIVILNMGENKYVYEQVSDRLEPVLLIAGILAICFLVIRTDNAMAIMMSVVIIGTVVAGERFLISVAALFGNTTQEGRDLVTNIYSRGRSNPRDVDLITDEAARAKFAEMIAEQIQVANEKGQEVQPIVSSLIEESQVRQLAFDVLNEGADFALLELSLRSTGEWIDWVDSVGTVPEFRDDMEFLRGAQLVRYTSQRYRDATITELGTRVIRAFGEIGNPDPPTLLERGPALSDLNVETLLIINAPAVAGEIFDQGFEFTDRASIWFSLDVPDGGNFIVETLAEGDDFLDTVLAIYDVNGVEKYQNDDSDKADGLYSYLAESLETGAYFIEIRSLGREAGKFRLRLQRAN